ncbi:MAG: hypothetical protein L6420_00105 [Elusimicrobia bacterium]|nr:hypothetical protein [Elusimicrobiota bacterium]
MKKQVKINTLFLLWLFGCWCLFAQNSDIGYGNINEHLMDPIFQDYVETIAGYSSLPLTNNISDFRDSLGPVKTGLKNSFVNSKNGLYTTIIKPQVEGKTGAKVKLAKIEPAVKSPAKKFYSNSLFYKVKFAGERGRIDSRVPPLDLYDSGDSYMNYIFVHILLNGQDASGFVDKISKEASFKFAGERKVLNKTGKTDNVLVLGWIPYKGFESIYKNPEVIKVSLEKSKLEFSAMTSISFVLKLPYQTEHSPFISSFLEDIGKKTGFMLDKTASFRENSAIMLITGKAPVDKISDIFQSPFVLQLKLTEQSI